MTLPLFIREPAKALRAFFDPFIGSHAALSERRHFQARLREFKDSLRSLEAGSGPPGLGEDPIFVLSAGWRSGSTLVQRMLMSGGNVLIWGEPFDRSCIVQRLSEMVSPFERRWPPASFYLASDDLRSLSESWVATLYPGPESLRRGFESFMHELLVRPARRAGATRWGLKEVRFGEREARFLHWLYPEAGFVFLVRDPVQAYRSYKEFSAPRKWYARWPEEPVFTARDFALHWRKVAGELAMCADDVGAMLVRYEDIISGRTGTEELAAHAGVSIDPDILEVRVGGPKQRSGLRWSEEWIVRQTTAKVARRLGY